MNFLANEHLRVPQLLPLPARHGLFQVFNLKTVWIVAALMVMNLSCASAPQSADSASETPTTAQLQAKAAAALAAADTAEPGSTNETLPASMPPVAVASAGASTNGDEILTNGMEALDDAYKLEVGDTITFQVTEDQDDPHSIFVQDSGDVVIPYLGRYPAAGKTCKGLAMELKKELEKKYYYQATVIITVNTMMTHGVIYVIGGVKGPGPMEMPRDEVLTVSKAILRAGGFDDFADEKHVRVTRKTDGGTNEVIIVNVSEVLDKGQTWKDQQVKPGDYIYVAEKAVHF